VRALPTVHLAANNALCVLNRDAALGGVQNHDEHNHRDGKNDEHWNQEVIFHFAARRKAQPGLDGGEDTGPAGNDAREDQNRDTVADALHIDLLTQPLNEQRARSERKDHNDGREHLRKHLRAAAINEGALAAQQEIISNAQRQRDARARVARDARQLLAAILSLFGQALQRRDGDREKLDDNRCVDIRRNAQREQRRAGKRTAGEHVDVTEHAAALSGHPALQRLRGDEGHGDGAAETENDDDQKCVKQLLAQIFDLPRIAECFKHFRSPQPSRLPSQFSPWRRRSRR